MLFLFSSAALVAALVFMDEARAYWWLYALAGAAVYIYSQQLSSVTVPDVIKTIRAPFSWLNSTLDNFGPVFVGVLMVVAWGLYQVLMFLRASYLQ